jgi:hypothetical protein
VLVLASAKRQTRSGSKIVERLIFDNMADHAIRHEITPGLSRSTSYKLLSTVENRSW